MFIEENKLLMEENLIQAIRGIGSAYIPGNWLKILVHIELYLIDNDLFIISNYIRNNISDLGLELAKIANSAYISPKDEENCPMDIVELEVGAEGNSQINYYEVPLDYTYHDTPELIWQYRKIGYKCRVLWGDEAASIVKKKILFQKKYSKIGLNLLI